MSENTSSKEDSVERSARYMSGELKCSAWEAFDRMQMCYAILPQMRHFYRYGTKKDCSKYRADWSFCMKLKTMPKDEAQKLLEEREAKRQEKMTTGRPSLEVWKLQDEPGKEPANFGETMI